MIVAFVGGAKLAHGLAAVVGGDLSIVFNTGDDFEHFDLAVSPDLDTVMSLGCLDFARDLAIKAAAR